MQKMVNLYIQHPSKYLSMYIIVSLKNQRLLNLKPFINGNEVQTTQEDNYEYHYFSLCEFLRCFQCHELQFTFEFNRFQNFNLKMRPRESRGDCTSLPKDYLNKLVET